jgi:hypothetical protein
LAESIAFSAKALQQINLAQSKAAGIQSVMRKTRAETSHAYHSHEWSFLHHECDRLEQILISEPSLVHAETFHAALIRFNEAKLTAERIGNALTAALESVSQSLGPVVADHLETVRQTIVSEADKSRAEIAKARHGLFNTSDESRALESRVAALLAELASERAEAATDPLGWLERNGLAMDGPEQAGTEAA